MTSRNNRSASQTRRLRLKSLPGMVSGFGGGQIMAVALLLAAVFLGGASREHALRLAIVELSALPLLAIALTRLVKMGAPPERRFAIGILTATVALLIVQIVPLPPSFWTSLPGRESMLMALDVSGSPIGWSPLSLSPDRTWASFLALLPAAAMFLYAIGASARDRRNLVALAIGLTVLSLLVGVAQTVTQSPSLYPWATTAPGWMVGFFANRNHLSTLCLITLPFAVVMGLGGASAHRRSLRLWLTLSYIGLIVVALATVRSRAGIILTLPALALSFAIVASTLVKRRATSVIVGALGVSLLAIVAVGFLAKGPLADRFAGTGEVEQRLERWPYVAEAAQAYSPIGSGVGSFNDVYRSVEPLSQLDATFFNQAHNEYLEIWLEAGIPGLLIVGAFFVWFFRRASDVWRRQDEGAMLGRAATVAVLVVAIHSVVDYPLRTETLAVIFALICAVLESGARNRSTGRDPALA